MNNICDRARNFMFYKNNPYNPFPLELRSRNYCRIISSDGKTCRWLKFAARKFTWNDYNQMIQRDTFESSDFKYILKILPKPIREDLYWIYLLTTFVTLNKNYDKYNGYENMMDEDPYFNETLKSFYFVDFYEMIDFMTKYYGVTIEDLDYADNIGLPRDGQFVQLYTAGGSSW